MKFQEKLKANDPARLWREYCGFLELNMQDYMRIQYRLMEEQVRLWSGSGLGRKLLDGASPASIDEFRRIFPLTTYEDYADVLLARRGDMLPGTPIVWVQTTWEGGIRPIKLAPYTREMLDAYKHNVMAIVGLMSARKWGEFCIAKGDRVLYGGAPLPYATGLLPSLMAEDIDLKWLPDGDGDGQSFSQRIRQGFKMAMQGGLDYVFATGSVANYMTEKFSQMASGGSGKTLVSPGIALRYLKAKYICKRDNRPMLPKDLFDLKGFVCTGTDAKYYRDRLQEAWGVRPIETAAGTESTCLASESQLEPGMVFFPDACFYEFIPENEMLRNLQDPSHQPTTCLMDQVKEGESYELVISVLHGGAFMRYRIGDVYRCISASKTGALPRFTFVDRIPTVIDIAGFTRITEKMIDEVIRLSGLDLENWLARKEYDGNNNPYFHMYIELSREAQANGFATKKLLTEHLAAYFKGFDSDYEDLKKLLQMEPLKITMLKYDTIGGYQRKTGRILPRINVHEGELAALRSYELGASIREVERL